MALYKAVFFFVVLIVCITVLQAAKGKGRGKGKGKGGGKGRGSSSSSENGSNMSDEDCPFTPKSERCENGQDAEFECPEGFIIDVLRAQYSCRKQGGSRRCKFPDELGTAKQLCDGQKNCTFPCDSNTFNETVCACEDGTRILKAKYQCLPDQCSTFCCANNGTCQLTDDGTPMCMCAGSWNGTHCDDNPCDSVTCENNGTCLVNLNDGTSQCACTDEYTGETCQTPRFCTPNSPCQNGGTCLDTDGRFDSCNCAGNFCGGLCECTKNPDDSCPC